MKDKNGMPVYNMRDLYNKKYGDIARMNKDNQITPEELFNFAVKYFKWAEEQYIRAGETASFQGHVYQTEVAKPRVFTAKGFCLFTGFNEKRLLEWRKKDGFSDVMAFVDAVIHEQKFQLAANGMVNTGFIMRDLGMTSSSENEVSISENEAIDSVKADEVRSAVKSVLEKL